MAEYIEKTDTLNEGREKLNEGIKASERAEGKSDQAVSTAQQAVNTASTAETKADSVQQQFNNVVIEGDSSVEAAQARVKEDGSTFDTLRDRLNSSDSQLAQTKSYAVETVSHNVSRDVKVSFTDDDGNARIMSILKDEIFDPEGVPASVCVNTSTVGNAGNVTWEELNILKNNGWTVFSHGHAHVDAFEVTEEELDYDYRTAKNILNSRGFNGDIFAYPYGRINDTAEKIARKNYIAGMSTFSSETTYNTMPLRTYYLFRHSSPPISSLADCKSVIDNAPDGAWIIFMGHVVEAEYDDPQTISDYRSLIQYIKSKGIDIVNVEEGLNQKGNVLDVGNRATNYFKIGRDGSVYKSDFNDHTIDNNTPISYFPMGSSRTYFNFNDARDKEFPGQLAGGNITPGSGTLITSRIQHDFYSTGEYASHQIYVGATSNLVFKRRWNVDSGSWTEWKVIQMDIKDYPFHYVEKEMNVFNASTPLTEFPARQIHTFYYNSTNQEGFPVYAGIVTTYRMNSDTWNRQECRGVNDRVVWSRYWTGTAWSAWERPTQLLGGMQRTVAATTIPANSTVDIITDLSSVSMSHTMVAKPQSAVENGIIWNCYAPQDGRGIIRLANITGSDISLAERVWVVDRLTHN